ncbi:MAG: Smr/MutS family protein [Haliscomenobacter sp.]|nr:Smr/MutS family protein [Haliscomenobacter sp.]
MKAIADDKEITHEVREAAEFLPELDLHIEKLVNDPAHLSNAQIAQLQLKVFEDYMDKAIRLGLERVFIIHGLGKGRLKDMIASRLIRMPEVLTFKNEFHPKYGHGATEVIFL